MRGNDSVDMLRVLEGNMTYERDNADSLTRCQSSRHIKHSSEGVAPLGENGAL